MLCFTVWVYLGLQGPLRLQNGCWVVEEGRVSTEEVLVGGWVGGWLWSALKKCWVSGRLGSTVTALFSNRLSLFLKALACQLRSASRQRDRTGVSVGGSETNRFRVQGLGPV